MSKFIIEGGVKLHDEITPQGAKNEALQILCATLLTSETVVVENIPDILDVNNLIDLLAQMGVVVDRTSRHTCSFCAANIDMEYLQTDDFKRRASSLRGSIMIMGPMIAR